jgi:hypothetical protein
VIGEYDLRVIMYTAFDVQEVRHCLKISPYQFVPVFDQHCHACSGYNCTSFFLFQILTFQAAALFQRRDIHDLHSHIKVGARKEYYRFCANTTMGFQRLLFAS